MHFHYVTSQIVETETDYKSQKRFAEKKISCSLATCWVLCQTTMGRERVRKKCQTKKKNPTSDLFSLSEWIILSTVLWGRVCVRLCVAFCSSRIAAISNYTTAITLLDFCFLTARQNKQFGRHHRRPWELLARTRYRGLTVYLVNN